MMPGYLRNSLGLGCVAAVISACSAGGGDASPGDTPGTGGAYTGIATGGTPTTGNGGASVGAGGTAVAAGGTGTGTGGAAGSSSGSGGASLGGAAGGPPFGGYDPKVVFDWPEAMASAGSCKAGKYSGTFDGIYLSPAAFGAPVPIVGTVDITLEESQDGEFFKLADGKIAGFALAVFPFSSGLTGTLNCTTAKLEGGFMPKGSYNAFGVDYPYEGPLDGDYDKLTNQFVNGKWAVGEPTYHRGDPLPVNGGQGTWTVKWVSP